MNKYLIIAVIVTAVVAGGTGYAMGVRAGSSSSSPTVALRGQGAQGGGQGGQNGQNSGRGRFRGNMVSGEILSLDASGITVKLDDGTTRIVFVGDNTSIFETASSSKKALTVGSRVRVSGEPGDAGSVTATRIDVGAMMQANMIRQRDTTQQAPAAQ